MYTRAIPRDLFNEAKLLKCLGQLALLVHDGKTSGLPLSVTHDGEPFDVDQDESDGSLLCWNVVVRCAGIQITVWANYNSQAPYPLSFDGEKTGVGPVFTDAGQFAEEFLAYCREMVGMKAEDEAWLGCLDAMTQEKAPDNPSGEDVQ